MVFFLAGRGETDNSIPGVQHSVRVHIPFITLKIPFLTIPGIVH
jgi:hypothetical protein